MLRNLKPYLLILLLLPLFGNGFFSEAGQATEFTPLSQEAEESINRAIKNAFKTMEDKGAVIHFKGKKLEKITLRQAMIAALRKNLSIKRGHQGEDIAKAALMEAAAVFDPVFNISASYSDSIQYGRTARDKRWKKASTINPDTGEHEIIFSEDAAEATEIKKIVLREARPAGFKEVTVQANGDQWYPQDETWSYNLTVSQLLPWGPSLNLGLAVTDKERYWLLDEFQRYGSYKRPWTSALSLSFFLPLPNTKNFGPYSGSDTSVKLAEVDKDRAAWVAKSVINATLLAVDHAYWDLVDRVKRLQVTMENKTNMEELVRHQKRLFEAGRATQYGMAQVEAELARVRALEEEAWNNYIMASNAMTDLLDSNKEAIFLPEGYSGIIGRKLPFERDRAVDVGMKHNPDLMITETDLNSSRITLRYSEDRLRPDININGQARISQNGQTFGYKSSGDSLTDILNGDKLYISVGLSYIYPWGNKALKSLLSQAKNGKEQQKILVRLTKNLVVLTINDSMADILSARARVNATRENLKLTRVSYGSARELRKAGRITEFETILKSVEVLNADYSYIAAVIDSKKADSSLLAAQGIIAELYGKMTAGDEFDRHRLAELAKGGLRYFGTTNE